MHRTHCVAYAPALRDQIERAALDEGRSMANLTRRILEHWATPQNYRAQNAERGALDI
jgi:hypothetical protein